MAKVKAKDLKPGDLFKDPMMPGAGDCKVVSIEPALTILYKVNTSYEQSRGVYQPEEKVDLIDRHMPELYTVADIEVYESIFIENGSVTGLFQVLDITESPGNKNQLRLYLERGSLRVSCLIVDDIFIKKAELPSTAKWILKSI